MILKYLLGQSPETESGAVQLFSRLLDNSVTVALSVAGIWIMYRGLCSLATWTADQLVVPVRDRAFGHLDRTTVALEKLTDTLDTLGQRIDKRSDDDRAEESRRHEVKIQKLDSIHEDVKVVKDHVTKTQHRPSMGE